MKKGPEITQTPQTPHKYVERQKKEADNSASFFWTVVSDRHTS